MMAHQHTARFNRNDLIQLVSCIAFAAAFILLMVGTAQGQGNVGINNPAPDPSALLDLTSSDKGLLPPRMTTAQRNGIPTPATGLLVFDTNVNGYYFYNGTAWVPFASGSTGWSITGNAGTTAASNFIGTTDSAPLSFRVNNLPAGRIEPGSELAAYGARAGSSLTSGLNNTLIGDSAGSAVTTGNRNSFLGASSGASVTSGFDNTLIGCDAGRPLTTGGNNTAVGSLAGQSLTSGFSNTLVGYSAGRNITSGLANVGVGFSAGAANVNGNHNIAIGTYSAFTATGGNNNITLGYMSGYTNTTGSNNIAIGTNAGYSNTTGSANISIGENAGQVNGTANENTLVGQQAGRFNTGGRNTFLGASSGTANTSGQFNTFVGALSGTANTTASSNTFLGYLAGRDNTTGGLNTFVGTSAGEQNTTGAENTFVGTSAGLSNLDGLRNTFLGRSAGRMNTSGNDNVFLGHSTGSNNTTGTQNTFVGRNAGASNTTGAQNTLVGHNVAPVLSTGSLNTLLGHQAAWGLSSGTNNTCLGSEAGYNTGAGADNVMVGYRAGFNNTGSGNTYLGRGSGGSAALTNATAIGYTAQVTANNSLVLGGTGANAVNVGIGTTAPFVRLEVQDNAGLIPMRVRNNVAAGFSVTQYISDNGIFGHVGLGNSAAGPHAGKFIVGSVGAVPVSITTADVERVHVTTTGRVGVGTGTPQAMTDITGNSSTGLGQLRLTETEQDFSRLAFYNTATPKFWEVAAMPHADDNQMAMNFYHSIAGNLMSLRGNGSLGLGTANPAFGFHVMRNTPGSTPIGIQSTSNNGVSGVTYLAPAGAVQGVSGWSNAANAYAPNTLVHGTLSNSPLTLLTNSAERMRIAADGNVGIGTNAPTTKLEVNGFTKLGNDAPAIKMKKLTTTTAAVQGDFVEIGHGLVAAKIIGVQVLVEYGPNLLISTGYTEWPGYHASFLILTNAIRITNVAGNSANVLSKPVRILITYEE